MVREQLHGAFKSARTPKNSAVFVGLVVVVVAARRPTLLLVKVPRTRPAGEIARHGRRLVIW